MPRPKTRVLATGIDTLYAALAGCWTAAAEDEIRALSLSLERRQDEEIEWAGLHWHARRAPRGAGLRLACRELTAALTPRAKRGRPIATFRLSCEALWSVGPEALLSLVEHLVRPLLKDPEARRRAAGGARCYGTDDFPGELRVIRMDLAADLAGWPALRPTDLDDVVTRAQHKVACELEGPEALELLVGQWLSAGDGAWRAAPAEKVARDLARMLAGETELRERYWRGTLCTGWRIGRSDWVGRLYDKTLELMDSGKEWFKPIWSAGGWDGESPVIRLEAQVRGAGLGSVLDAAGAPLEGRPWRETFAALGAVWSYFTHDWARWCRPTRGTRRERWPERTAWTVAQAATWGDTAREWTRGRQQAVKRDELGDQLYGVALSWMALSTKQTPLERLCELQDELDRRARRKQDATGEDTDEAWAAELATRERRFRELDLELAKQRSTS